MYINVCVSNSNKHDEGRCDLSPFHMSRLGCIGGGSSPPSFSRIASGLKLAQTQAMAVAVAGFIPQPKRSPLLHRASFHGRGIK